MYLEDHTAKVYSDETLGLREDSIPMIVVNREEPRASRKEKRPTDLKRHRRQQPSLTGSGGAAGVDEGRDRGRLRILREWRS